MLLCANPSAQFNSYQSEIEEAVLSVMRGNRYILGGEVKSLEEEFADYIGVKSAVGVANGTDAIELALRALSVGFGDEVITVSHTAVATIAAIEATGATAVLVDIDAEYYTLNTDQLSEAFSDQTRAIIAVHIYGQAVDLNVVKNFCDEKDIFLIEDCSQAHGALFQKKRLGSIGDIGCFSCYPTKNLGAIGDAGILTTNDMGLAQKIRKLREYGWNNRVSEYPGRNSRLDEIQAAILRVKLKYLDADNTKRRDLADYYSECLSESHFQLPSIRPENISVFHLYVMQVEMRDGLLDYLLRNGIQCGIHYPIPVHLQPAYKNRILTSNNMSVTENVANKIISLPMYPELSKIDAKIIIDKIKSFYTENDNYEGK